MAILKPLVIQGGRIQRLQAGDSLDTGADVLQRTFTPATAIGSAVYVSGPGAVSKAQANALGTVEVLGLAFQSVGAGNPGGVVTNGQITATTGEWDAITGQIGGLTTNSLYFLSATTVGALVIEGSVTTTTGQYVKRVGLALSSTEMEVRVHQEILL